MKIAKVVFGQITTEHYFYELVHVTKSKNLDGSTITQYICAIYNHLKWITYNQFMQHRDEELFPDFSMVCMHYRYFREKLLDPYNNLQSNNTNLRHFNKYPHV